MRQQYNRGTNGGFTGKATDNAITWANQFFGINKYNNTFSQPDHKRWIRLINSGFDQTLEEIYILATEEMNK